MTSRQIYAATFLACYAAMAAFAIAIMATR